MTACSEWVNPGLMLSSCRWMRHDPKRQSSRGDRHLPATLSWQYLLKASTERSCIEAANFLPDEREPQGIIFSIQVPINRTTISESHATLAYSILYLTVLSMVLRLREWKRIQSFSCFNSAQPGRMVIREALVAGGRRIIVQILWSCLPEVGHLAQLRLESLSIEGPSDSYSNMPWLVSILSQRQTVLKHL